MFYPGSLRLGIHLAPLLREIWTYVLTPEPIELGIEGLLLDPTLLLHDLGKCPHCERIVKLFSSDAMFVLFGLQ